MELDGFFTPENSDEVIELLAQFGDEALVLGGGTFIHSLAVRGLLARVRLIDLRNLALVGIESASAGVRLGARTRCAALARGPSEDGRWLGAVHDAARHLPLQVRNAATVGGCVAAASPFFDLPVAFMALDGVVGARGSNGIREIDIEALYLGLFENSLQQTEFIVSVTLPRMPAGSASAFVKFASNANDLAIVSAAARVTVDASGRCTDARVVIGGGVANRPWRSRAAEGVLQGATLGTDTLEAAGDAAASDVEPLSDHRASGRYRKAVAGVLVRRALTAALARVP